MSLALKALKKSPWVFHVNTGACNNCDIEILDVLTPKYDVERFGITLIGSPRHADVLLVTGVVTMQTLPRVLRVYEQVARPCLVIAIGTCARGIQLLATPGCRLRPIDGVLQFLDIAVCWGDGADLLDGDAVVAMDLQLHLHLAQVLHQVVGE